MCKFLMIIKLSLLSCVINAQVAWDYPIKPGTEEWYRLETEQERIDVLQVPEEVLAALSPDDAVLLCITFPSFGHFTAWNTPQEGFAVLFYLELLLSQKEILHSLTHEEKLALMTEARAKYFEKNSNENFASLPEMLFSLRIMLSILAVDEYPELLDSPNRDALTEFVNTGWLFEKGLPIGEIGRIVDNYLKIN